MHNRILYIKEAMTVGSKGNCEGYYYYGDNMPTVTGSSCGTTTSGITGKIRLECWVTVELR